MSLADPGDAGTLLLAFGTLFLALAAYLLHLFRRARRLRRSGPGEDHGRRPK